MVRSIFDTNGIPWKKVKHSPDLKMIKLLTFDILFSRHDIHIKTRSKMTTATTFSQLILEKKVSMFTGFFELHS